jgi:small subunit ribosomal protein S16
MLTIRLQRGGKRHAPFYRLVIADKARHVTKKIIANIGTYSPATKVLNLTDKASLEKYLNSGATVSTTAKSILTKAGFNFVQK